MANLTGMPISSLPETTLQEGDQVVGYRAETGKAYRTDLADQIADLTEQVNQLNQSLTELNIFEQGTQIPDGADMNDYTKCGNYYISDSSASGNTISNLPESINGGGKVLIFPTEISERPIQIFFSKNIDVNGIIFRTRYASSAWSSWNKVTTTAIS